MRTLAAITGTVLLIFAVIAGATAQDDAATPPLDGTPAASADPIIGEIVTYADDSDNPIANVTVEEVVRDQEDTLDLDEDELDPGIEYIVFVVTVENVNARGTVDVIDLDFSLHDSDGYLWGASVVPTGDDLDATPLPDEGVTLGDSESVTFLLVYEVAAEQGLAHLFWQPDSGRLITLASLAGQ